MYEAPQESLSKTIFGRTLSRLRCLPRPLVFVMLVGLSLLLGVLDTLLPRQLSLAVFQVVPVFIAMWCVGPRSAVALALLGSVSWFTSDQLSTYAPATFALELWDFAVKLAFLLVICALMYNARRSADCLAALSNSDPLTGLANRRGLAEYAEREMERARRFSRPLSVIYLDLDDFKAVNDTQGHKAGDRVLQVVGHALRSCVRRIDLVARIGGDEFVVVLTEIDTPGARLVVGKVEAVLQEQLEAFDPPLSASIGGVTFNVLPPSFEEMLAFSDKLMYEVKQSGKGSTRLAEQGSPAPQAALMSLPF